MDYSLASVPAPAAPASEFTKRTAPAIFVIDAVGNVVHAFGKVAPWIGATGQLAPAVGRIAMSLVADRIAHGGTPAGLAGDVTLRLIEGGADVTGPYCLIVEKLRTRDPLAPAIARYQISPREAQVLQHILAGEGTAAIAHALQIAETTAAAHIKNIARKTEARSRGQIVARILGFL